nr:ribonuclease H-like domain-containing protein [Tanacetum cinerariifolium]
MKRTGRDRDGWVIILPPTTADEHIAVQRESKARTTLLQSILDDYVADFHYIDDTRDIWNAFKARFDGNAESKKMRNSMLKQEYLEFRIEDEDINLKFLRALPSSWSHVALTLKTKGGLKLLSFDDLYYKLKTLEVDFKGYTTLYSSQSAVPSNSAFVSSTSASKKMSYRDSPSYSSTTTYSAPSNSKTGSHRSGNVIEDVLQSFVADTEPEQQLAYEDFEQIEKLDLEEMDLKWQMAMLSVRVHKFEQKAGRKINFDKKESARAKEGNDKQRYSSFKIKEIGKKEEDLKALITVDTLVIGHIMMDAIKEGAAKIYSLITGADTEEASTAGDAGEFALMGVTSEVHTCPFGCDNKENELGWDDSAFSVFTTNSEDVEGRPLFNRFAKADSMKAVPPPLSGDYTSLSDHIDLDESQMSYGTKSSISSDSKSMSNDFVSCDDSDKSSVVNTNDFAFNDSSVKSLEPKANDSTSCASTSSVSTSKNKAEIESSVGTPIQEPIIVQDLPSLSCNSSDKNENTSRTSCNKNGYFTKKAGSGHSRIKVNHQKQFVLQAVLLRTGNVNIPPARPQSVPTSKPKVFAPVLTGRQNRPFSVPTNKGYSLSVISGWWKNRQLRLSPQQVVLGNHIEKEHPFPDVEDKGIFDSGCFRSMTGNKERLDAFQEFQGGKVTFGGGDGRITGKGTIRTPTLDFENVYYVKELQQFNLFSISQICDKKNRVLFTDTECLVLSKDFKLPDESKQHKASYKAINAVSSVSKPLQLLYVDLFGPTSIRSIDHKYYCLVITDDYIRFCWVFFLEHKDVTYPILRDFINLVENQLNKKVKAMRCDNGTKFKNAHIIEFCGSKGIKREYSNARTLQQNEVAKRKNKTLIEAARTMLADSKLPTMFWTKAVSTACYVLNRVLVTSPHNKTPYALLTGNIPSVSNFKPFGCHVTILNTSDHLVSLLERLMKATLLDTLQVIKPTESTTNPISTQDADSDSDGDEQVIIVPSYPSHSIQGTEPNDTSADEVDDSPLNSADEIFQKELARLNGQAQRATSDAESLGMGFANDDEKLQNRASAKIVPPGSIPVTPLFVKKTLCHNHGVSSKHS